MKTPAALQLPRRRAQRVNPLNVEQRRDSLAADDVQVDPLNPEHVEQRHQPVAIGAQVNPQDPERIRESVAVEQVDLPNLQPIQQRRESVAIGIQVNLPNSQPIQQRRQSVSVGIQAGPSSLDSPDAWCICRGEEYGEMIFCENPMCRIEWFHLDCMKMQTAPEGEWYCQNCQLLNDDI